MDEKRASEFYVVSLVTAGVGAAFESGLVSQRVTAFLSRTMSVAKDSELGQALERFAANAGRTGQKIDLLPDIASPRGATPVMAEIVDEGLTSDDLSRIVREARAGISRPGERPSTWDVRESGLDLSSDPFAERIGAPGRFGRIIGAKTWQEYEAGIRSLYGEASFSAREYFAIVDGKLVRGIADNVTEIAGKSVAIEAKWVDNWATSLCNPASPIGNRSFAVAEQAKMLEQARKYSAAFDEVIYHSNSPELIAYYTRVFRKAGITNFRFILTR